MGKEDAISLSPVELARLENDKQIYCLLRMLNFTQKFYSTDKINEETYQTERKRLMDKYERFKNVTPNFDLKEFLKRYSIPTEEVNWAVYLIQKGGAAGDERSRQVYMHATVTLIEVIDSLTLENMDTLTIANLKSSPQRLQAILHKIHKDHGPFFIQKFEEYCRLLKKYITSRSVNDTLTASEANEIRNTVEAMYQIIMQPH